MAFAIDNSLLTGPMWPARRSTWLTLGVGARLLFAFLGISGFAVLAAAAGIYAITQVGAQLDRVDARVPVTLASLDLSAPAERIIAAAPALLAATERQRREEVTAQLAEEVARLNGKLRELEADDAQGPLLPWPLGYGDRPRRLSRSGANSRGIGRSSQVPPRASRP